MSQENVELVRRFAEAFPHRVEEMLSYLDPEGELHSAIVGGAEGNVYRGHEGFASGTRTHSRASRSSATSGASFAISAIASSPSGTLKRAGARVGWSSTPQWAG
jgi:hypothetical protein